VLAHTAGEHQSIDSIERRGNRCEVRARAMHVHADGHGSIRIAGRGATLHVAHVPHAGETGQSGLVLESCAHALGVHAASRLQPHESTGVDAAAARGHDHSFEGRESHARVGAVTLADRGDGRTRAEVRHQDVQILLALVEQTGRTAQRPRT